MKRRMPSDDEIETAAAWLRVNDGQEGESDACQAVADWIEQQMQERTLRTAAREGGMTVARLRREIAKRQRAEEARQRGEEAHT